MTHQATAAEPAAVPVRTAPAPAGSRRTKRRDGRWTPWVYLAPALVVLAGLLVYPIYQLGLISFLEYTQAQVSGGEPTTFQGFGNYRTLFADRQFWRSCSPPSSSRPPASSPPSPSAARSPCC